MTQAAYNNWLHEQLHPNETPYNIGGAPVSRGGKGLAPWMVNNIMEQQRREREQEITRMEDEYLRRKGVE